MVSMFATICLFFWGDLGNAQLHLKVGKNTGVLVNHKRSECLKHVNGNISTKWDDSDRFPISITFCFGVIRIFRRVIKIVIITWKLPENKNMRRTWWSPWCVVEGVRCSMMFEGSWLVIMRFYFLQKLITNVLGKVLFIIKNQYFWLQICSHDSFASFFNTKT